MLPTADGVGNKIIVNLTAQLPSHLLTCSSVVLLQSRYLVLCDTRSLVIGSRDIEDRIILSIDISQTLRLIYYLRRMSLIKILLCVETPCKNEAGIDFLCYCVKNGAFVYLLDAVFLCVVLSFYGSVGIFYFFF